MRKLKTSDIPAFCRCLKQIGLKDKLREIAQKSDTASDAWGKGFDLVWDIFDIATETSGERALYQFLAGPFEMTADEVANLDVPVLLDSLKELAKENNLPGFFRSVQSFLTK